MSRHRKIVSIGLHTLLTVLAVIWLIPVFWLLISSFRAFAYVADMPKTNTANQSLMDYFCEVGAHWIREYDIDGWRLDVANEVDDVFLRSFRDTVKREKSDALDNFLQMKRSMRKNLIQGSQIFS
ncbi:Alpha amylase, catalytic domain [Lachnospiraceae bacterium]|nr:Alpha amylase, catalytic domain [Lachnospiraceae bacterium]